MSAPLSVSFEKLCKETAVEQYVHHWVTRKVITANHICVFVYVKPIAASAVTYFQLVVFIKSKMVREARGQGLEEFILIFQHCFIEYKQASSVWKLWASVKIESSIC